MKRSAPRKFRPTLRRGEPTPAEKKSARERCFNRAGGMCELQLVAECWGFAPLDGDDNPMSHGHLCHEHSKRVYGWMESEKNRHNWGCPPCHAASHNAGGKPVRSK